MSKPSKFAKSADAKKAGWFSRRHQTDAAHRKAQEERRARQQQKMALAKAQALKTEGGR